MQTDVYKLDAAERALFREAFEENLDLLLDILEAMQCESTHAADPTSAQFLGGVHQALHAFGRVRGYLSPSVPAAVRGVIRAL
jgi:hypothetical protein